MKIVEEIPRSITKHSPAQDARRAEFIAFIESGARFAQLERQSKNQDADASGYRNLAKEYEVHGGAHYSIALRQGLIYVERYGDINA